MISDKGADRAESEFDLSDGVAPIDTPPHCWRIVTVYIPEGRSIKHQTLDHAVTWMLRKSRLEVDQLNVTSEGEAEGVMIGSVNCDIDPKAKAVASQILTKALL